MTLDNCKLKRICYETSGGAMNFHSEFELEASADEVIRTSYWKDFVFDRVEQESTREKLDEIDNSYRTNAGAEALIVREHIPMDKELWDALSEEMEYLKEQLEPIKSKPAFSLPKDVFVLDGGDYTRIYLTWEDGDEEKTAQYCAPNGRRWSAVIDILHEMARPLGRDLHRIGKTQLADMLLKAPEYSYQISPIQGGSDYYFFVHGDKSPINKLTSKQWSAVRDSLNGMDFSKFGPGKYECKHYLKLGYNDGITKHLEIDNETAERIRGILQLGQ